jgi:hypothetical protein
VKRFGIAILSGNCFIGNRELEIRDTYYFLPAYRQAYYSLLKKERNTPLFFM